MPKFSKVRSKYPRQINYLRFHPVFCPVLASNPLSFTDLNSSRSFEPFLLDFVICVSHFGIFYRDEMRVSALYQ